ncbi:MAG: ATP phosphoribosyltransferase [Chloroflexota bacterium]|nr:ATP phosphoribosyltransferase [Chloroflexota bacterium]
MNAEPDMMRLALPGKGALETATLAFLAECGLKVSRNNPRQYLARMKSMPEMEVVFQRAADIPLLVRDGDAMLGITGYDILAEHRGDGGETRDEDEQDDELIVLERDLGYGACQLVVAVPETWIDVSTCADLWHLAGYYQSHKRRGLRIATKYPALTKQFLRSQGITHCKIVTPHGALEAAPLTGTADLIVDLTETGTTLRENRLKLLHDGVVLQSQACLIANAQLLKQNPALLRLATVILELVNAHMQARNRSMLTASIPKTDGDTHTTIIQRLKVLLPGFECRVAGFEADGDDVPPWYTLSGMVSVGRSAPELVEMMTALRAIGAEHIDVTPLTYRFGEEPASVRALSARLARMS